MTLGYVSDVLFARDPQGSSKGKEREMEGLGDDLPRTWELLGMSRDQYLPIGGRAVVIGVHGWFPGKLSCKAFMMASHLNVAIGFAMRTVIGEVGV